MDAQRTRSVTRAELFSDNEPPQSGSGRPSTDLDPSLLPSLTFENLRPASPTPDPTSISDPEFEFHLFAPPQPSTTTAPAATKIRLASPSPVHGADALLRPRDPSHYLAPALTPERAAALRTVAVTGDAVRGWAGERWPGCAVPWRVTALVVSRSKVRKLAAAPPVLSAPGGEGGGIEGRIATETIPRRGRAGKKARVKLRMRMRAAAVEREEGERKKREEEEEREKKEEAMREKRNRRNREKKIKRRAKERLKKAQAGVGGGEGVMGGEAEEGDSGSGT